MGFVLAFVFGSTGTAWSSEVTATASLSEDVAALNQEAKKVRTWWRGWMGGFASLVAVQGAGYFILKGENMKTEMLVGGAGALLGFAGMVISPLPNVWRADREVIRIMDEAEAAKSVSNPVPAAVPGVSTEDLIRVQLQRAAQAERDGRNWFNHVLGAAVPIASAVLLWTVWEKGDAPTGGITTLGAGLAISAAQLYTQPYKLARRFGRPAATVQLAPVLSFEDRGTVASLQLMGRF